MTFAFALVRALHFASLMTVFGASALLFQARSIGLDGTRFHRPLFFASLTALATAVLCLVFVAQEMTGESMVSLALLANVVAHSLYGTIFLWRFFLLLILCVICAAKGLHLPKALLGGGALALLSLTSHAAAGGTDGFHARAAVDALHLLAAAFWFGGLAVLVPEVLAKPRNMPRLILLLRLFSRWGALSVAILIAAGALNAVFILNVPGMRWSGTYVTLLAIKIVLAALMVALALTNRFGVLPGLAHGEAEAAETIPLTVVAELGAALLILSIVGFLGLTAPMEM